MSEQESMRMPQRPRTHVVETESRRAFRNLLPSEWVPRVVEPDYGIDEVVEVFEGNNATGLSFYVQIRATDDTDLKRALAARFRLEQLNYFAAQDLPVLIVRFHAPSGRLYGRWFHRLEVDTTADTVTIRFSEGDHLGPESFSSYTAELRAVRSFRPPGITWPLRLELATSEPYRPPRAPSLSALALQPQDLQDDTSPSSRQVLSMYCPWSTYLGTESPFNSG